MKLRLVIPAGASVDSLELLREGAEIRIDVLGPPPPPKSPCEFDDCPADAMFCSGHALEFAQVTDSEEAPQLRDALRDLTDAVARFATSRDSLSAPLSVLDTWHVVLAQSKAARALLDRRPS